MPKRLTIFELNQQTFVLWVFEKNVLKQTNKFEQNINVQFKFVLTVEFVLKCSWSLRADFSVKTREAVTGEPRGWS